MKKRHNKKIRKKLEAKTMINFNNQVSCLILSSHNDIKDKFGGESPLVETVKAIRKTDIIDKFNKEY